MSDDYRPYDVALWRWWPPRLFPEYMDEVYALTSTQAVLSLMERENKQRVARAAVKSLDGTIEHWRDVDVELLREGHVSIEVRLVWLDGRMVALDRVTGKPLAFPDEDESEG